MNISFPTDKQRRYAARINEHIVRGMGYTMRTVDYARARGSCLIAFNQAIRDEREFTPIYWYLTDDDQLVMTLWDMT